MHTMSTITVNGEPRQINPDMPLVSLLAEIGIDVDSSRGVAVAIDDTVIRKKNWASHVLHPGARVEVVTAKQGG